MQKCNKLLPKLQIKRLNRSLDYISFMKYSGAGNDFVLIDNRELFFPCEKMLLQKMCDRKMGIGADGVILWETSSLADHKIRFFNADGSEAEMCGNGLRCFAGFLKQFQNTKDECVIETPRDPTLKIHRCRFHEENVQIEMGVPDGIALQKSLILGHVNLFYDALNTGVPHVVLKVEDLHNLDVLRLGKTIRWHPDFAPLGTNVNFMTTNDLGEISIRTFERGVEAETLACGTGVIATALVLAIRRQISSPITIGVASGDKLQVYFSNDSGNFHNIWLSGPYKFLFSGEYIVD